MKLLIIDDEKPVLEMLELSLSSEGYDVLTAESGSEGLSVFADKAPEIVITDIKMPGMDGIEVLKRIKSANEDAEVIVITGHGDMDSAIQALQNGASDFITKPIRDEVLMLSLDRAKKKLSMSKQLRDYTENLEDKVEACKVELEEAQEEIIRNERLATIGETVAGLAHYIKNILTGLRGGMYMVNVGLDKDKPQMLREGWGVVSRNVERVSELVMDLLTYSKDRKPEPTDCNPKEIVSDVLELLKDYASEHRVELATELDPDIEHAHLDKSGIHRVLLNLVSNAIDACIFDPDTDKTWQVTVGTRLEEEEETVLVFEVSDNGVGMTEEVQEKLFSRFFSTKEGRGTGLGLLITQKIVEEHGGEVKVTSASGKGTTFSVRLKGVV
jgi:signal transduction histidine kinase